MKGCGTALYWIFIGWWFFPIKWMCIGLFRLCRWLWIKIPFWINQFSLWLEKRFLAQGHNWGIKKIKLGVVGGLLLLIPVCCVFSSLVNHTQEPVSGQTVSLSSQTTTGVGFSGTLLGTSGESSLGEVSTTPSNVFVSNGTADLAATLPEITSASCVPTNTLRQSAIVTKVIDGDTIHVTIDGSDHKVRYIGMDAPEVGMSGADAATSLNSQLVMGKTITLVKDVSETDQYGRLLRYVLVGDTFVNYELVRSGLATAGTWAPDTACDATLKSAQTVAKLNLNGLWNTTPVPAVVPTAVAFSISTSQSSTQVVSSGCAQGCTEHIPGCDIKGNISSKGEKIYHVPGQEYYDETVITPSKGERWFCTELEALNNGWRKSKR